MQSQIWKQMVSFKHKLLGDSSILPSSILEMVARKSRTVLLHQSNSVQMPDYCGCGSKRPRLEHGIMTPGSTVVIVPEDVGPELNTTQEHCVSPESLDPDCFLFGDELFALFDSDNQKKSDTSARTSSDKSEFLPPTVRAYKLSVT